MHQELLDHRREVRYSQSARVFYFKTHCCCRSICRQVSLSSLEMPELLLNITDTINIIQSSKLEERKPAESGMLDRLWRRTLKMPESPKRSMLRSASASSGRRKQSRSRSASLETRGGETSQAEEFAEMIVQAVKAVMAKHLTGVDLQDHSAGEIRLSQGRLSGLWKVSRGGGESLIDCGSQWNNLSFSVVVRGLLSSYHFRSVLGGIL